jgi:hypothetical protein
MADTVIESFLVKLGFNVDQTGAKRFNDSVKLGIESVKVLGEALVAVGIAVEEMVRRTTRNLTTLFYAAQAGGTTAAALKGIQAGAEAAGLSAQDASAALAAINDALNKLEGHQRGRLAEMFGDFKDPADLLNKIVISFNGLQESSTEYESRMRELNALLPGISDKVRVLTRNQHEYFEAQRRTAEIAKAFGLNWDEAAKKARATEESFRTLGRTIEGAFTVITAAISDDLQGTVEEVQQAILEFARDPEVQKAFKDMAAEIHTVATEFREWMSHPENRKAVIDDLKMMLTILERIVGAGAWIIGHWAKAIELLSQTTPKTAEEAVQVPREMEARMRARGLKPPSNNRSGLEYGLSGEWWSSLKSALGFQHGGIVPANLHAGEMVLPREISMGMQSMFAGFSPSQGMYVRFAGEVYDNLGEMLKRVLRELHQSGEFGFGGGSGDGGGDGGGGVPRTSVAGGGRMPGRVRGGGAAANVESLKGQQLPAIMKTGLGLGATGAVMQGLVAAALGEGGVEETWKMGDKAKGGSFGPWQLFTHGRLQEYLAQGFRPGNIEDQTKFVLKTMERLHPGFSKLTDAHEVTRLMHDVFKDYGAREANVAPAGRLIARIMGGAGKAVHEAVTKAAAVFGPPVPPDPNRAAGARGGLPPWQKYNSRGEPISAHPGGENAKEAANIAASMAWIRAHMGQKWPGAEQHHEAIASTNLVPGGALANAHHEVQRHRHEVAQAKTRHLSGVSQPRREVTINVHGAHDPHGTGAQAVRWADRLSGESVRNKRPIIS